MENILAVSCAMLLLSACVDASGRQFDAQGSGPDSTPSASAAQARSAAAESGLVRRSRVRRLPEPLLLSCGGDQCDGGATFVRVRTPEFHDFVDVVMTLTIHYRTTAGDRALLDPGFRLTSDDGRSTSISRGSCV